MQKLFCHEKSYSRPHVIIGHHILGYVLNDKFHKFNNFEVIELKYESKPVKMCYLNFECHS